MIGYDIVVALILLCFLTRNKHSITGDCKSDCASHQVMPQHAFAYPRTPPHLLIRKLRLLSALLRQHSCVAVVSFWVVMVMVMIMFGFVVFFVFVVYFVFVLVFVIV